MRPTGKYVLILQDEAPVKEEVVLKKGALISTPDEIIAAARELSSQGAFRAEWETGIGDIQASKAPEKPNTGTIVYLGKDADRTEFDGGDRVEWAPHQFRKYTYNGTEFCLIREDYILINFTKD